jgi:CRP-like cAMP-binding protein
MFDELIEKIMKDKSTLTQFQDLLLERQIRARTIILHEGHISNHVHFIKKGCLRMWFNKDGKEITFQFFFEGQAVASIDSFLNNQPSLFTLESIEPSNIISISKDKFEQLNQFYPEFKDRFQNILFQRFRNYAQLFLSRIKDTPAERYKDCTIKQP